MGGGGRGERCPVWYHRVQVKYPVAAVLKKQPNKKPTKQTNKVAAAEFS